MPSSPPCAPSTPPCWYPTWNRLSPRWARRSRPVSPSGLHEPARLLADIVDALEAYWQTCLLPNWPRIRSVLESDLAHRARTLAEHGAAGLFTAISDRLTWDEGILAVLRNRPRPAAVSDIPINGRRLLFTPSCFVDGVSTTISPHAPPHVVHTARGLVVLAENAAPTVPRSLERLLGRPRARLLALLAEPATTTELARRLGVTPPAVNQHLAVLTTAGLVDRTRYGRHVHYRHTPLGAALHTGSWPLAPSAARTSSSVDPPADSP
ncbi:ArsR/SmtB family transcription factor [Kitasatospora cineracea]|uniref:ArsR/SmtB family transcription factor n=1 Tax=Kitasatospora cineracea TaxID=88074 RepID=UPI0036DDAE9B